MKVLLLAEDMPNVHPVHGDGSSLIPFHLLRQIKDVAETWLVTFAGEIDVPVEVTAACRSITVLPIRSHRTAMAGAPLSGKSIGAFQRHFRHNRKAIKNISAWADATLIHGPQALPFWRDVVSPLAIQTVDPWSMRVRMEADMSRGLRRCYLRWRSRQFQRAESRLPHHVRLMTVGERDARLWAAHLGRPVRGVPNGISHPSRRTAREAPVDTVCFVGSLNYPPNIDSARRIRHDIAPRVWESLPTCRFVVAGRQPTRDVLDLAGANFEIRGDVPQISDVFDAAAVALFPDRFGLGVRNSVAEALGSGVPVVASKVASRGLPAMPSLLVGDSDRELAAHVVRVLMRPRPPDIDPQQIGADWSAVARTYLDELFAAMRSPNGTVEPPARPERPAWKP